MAVSLSRPKLMIKIEWLTECSYDSYPYACIVMLSQTEGMVGGETYIKRGDGTVVNVVRPSFGCAYIIQGVILGFYPTPFNQLFDNKPM